MDPTEATKVLSSLDESSAVPRSMVGTWDDQPKRFGKQFHGGLPFLKLKANAPENRVKIGRAPVLQPSICRGFCY